MIFLESLDEIVSIVGAVVVDDVRWVVGINLINIFS